MRTRLLLALLLPWVACKKDSPSTPVAAPAPPPASATAATPQEVPITSVSPGAIDAFRAGRDLYEDARNAEAITQFKRALELDPNFAQCHAYLGLISPGPGGVRHMETAGRLVSSLPPVERLVVEELVARQRGDEPLVHELRRKLAEAAPTDWRAQWRLGQRAFEERKWDEAVTILRKATTLNPSAGPALNLLGYTFLSQGKYDDAIDAFRRYVTVEPNYANPHDSLGEALLAAGRFEEAEASFRKATETSQVFYSGWEGIAWTHFYRGNWAEGRTALGKAREVAARPFDKLETDLTLAWTYQAEGNTAEALKTIDKIDMDAKLQEADWWRTEPSLQRAAFLVESGKPAEGLKQLDDTVILTAKSELPGVSLNDLRRESLYWRVWAESRLGKAGEAARTAAEIEIELKKAPTNVTLQSEVHFARGALALAKSDLRGAATHFAQCDDEDFFCRYQWALTLERLADAEAPKARYNILHTFRRNARCLYVVARMGGIKTGAQ